MSEDLSGEGIPSVADATSSDWLNSLGSLTSIVVPAYKTLSGQTIKEQAATLAAAQAKLTTVNTTAVPWYKAAWVIPVAIGAGLLLVLGLFSGRR